MTTSYYYDAAGSLTKILYSDTTPSVTNSYDRLGRLSQQSTRDYQMASTFDLAGDSTGEAFTGGPLNGLSVTNVYDTLLRRTNLVARSSLSQLLFTTYGYDNASRLSTVSDGNNNSATYSYIANSPLVSQIVFQQSGATRMTTTKQYDYLNRLTSISSASSQLPAPISYNYNYNTANQRTKNALADGSYWVYQYDSLGQVTGGNKYFRDGTPVPGQQFGYSFDDIGNRTQTKTGGDQTGGNQRIANYTANNLNQITVRDVPGTNDVVGVALATNGVTVNGQTAWRKGEYFWSTVKTNNTASATWENVAVASGGTTNTGNLFVPQTPEQFGYDADGNLTNDGRWSYVWDAENRLVQMTVNTNVGPQYQLNFAYDAKSRRIQKTVAISGTPVSTNSFLYDGWNLVAILTPNSQFQSAYIWGTDLSGTMQGAGGVGGLLAASYYGSSTTNAFAAYDGNGNVMALVNAADGTTLANYEYGPFGETIRVTGALGKCNRIRFSTKYQDDEADVMYYGYRFYRASTGTWLQRDPVKESGASLTRTGKQMIYKNNVRQLNQELMDFQEFNPNCFIGNNPVQLFDVLGLFATLDTSGCSGHAKDIDDAWKKAQKVIQDAIDNNKVPTWGSPFFDCLSDDKHKIPVKCSCLGSWLRCSGSMVAAHGVDTIYLCPSAFANQCQLATALAVEAAKVNCGVTMASGEYKFNSWLRDKLGCEK